MPAKRRVLGPKTETGTTEFRSPEEEELEHKRVELEQLQTKLAESQLELCGAHPWSAAMPTSRRENLTKRSPTTPRPSGSTRKRPKHTVTVAVPRTKGDYDKAIADCSEAIKIAPSSSSAYCMRGRAYRAKGDCDKAIADYNEAIRLKPDYDEAIHRRGLAYNDKVIADCNKAIADFTEAIRLHPEDAVGYCDRGRAYGKRARL